MKKLLFTLFTAFCFTGAMAQTEIYPGNWWTGMKMNKIQLLLRDRSKQFSQQEATINYPGITVDSIHRFPNGKYLVIDITISPDAKPGDVNIILTDKNKKHTIPWLLKQQRPGNGTEFAQGVTSSDLIDLLITDRFSNGDVSNDRIKDMKDQSLDRDSMYLRHGGDFKGILNHVDYFKSLGVTALWLLPVMENDMPRRTEHGYAITNHYKIDPRYGSAALYKQLSSVLHKNGIKLIMDAVYNHTGLQHFLEQDPPSDDWMHRWSKFTQTSFREQTLFDPYAAPSETKRMTDGWFEPQMPDINHSNPYMANYLIQNMIWYIEEYGVDAVRVDTYTYSDGNFANRCNKAILDEFPKLTMFGETRVFGAANQSYFNENIFDIPFKSNMQGSVDFQCLYYGIIPALTQPSDWTGGVNKLYNTLSCDYLNKDASRNVLLLDNHDEPRFFSIVGEDVEKQKTGYKWLLTCRGIPQLYYGSEVLLKGFTNPDGYVRADFPGGWNGDKKDAFTGIGLTKDETSVQDLVKKLGNFRKGSSALKTGKMMQYIPVDGLYVYFRYDKNQTIMCIMNTSQKEQLVDFYKYSDRTAGFSSARDITDNRNFSFKGTAKIPSKQMWVLELGRD